MHYRSIADLNRDVLRWIRSLPDRIDLVVGIPRSGLLVANLISLHTGLPFTDVDGFLDGRLISGGFRFRRPLRFPSDQPLQVLVVDDSLYTGQELARTRDRIDMAGLPHRIAFGVVYAHPKTRDLVDHYYEAIPHPRVFEWNVLHHPALPDCCVDIDGVLCRDPTDEENDDGERYREFLTTVDCRYQSRVQLGWLVTSRLEKYRPECEAWLARHGIEYRALIMLDMPDAEARRRANIHARHKAEAYRRTDAWLFIESAAHQAAEIANLSGRPVFCTDERAMYYPGNRTTLRQSDIVRRKLRSLYRRVTSPVRLQLGGRRVAGESR